MRHLPNILSCARIFLSLALLLVLDKLAVFLTLYLLCGLTDIADGVIARRLNAETRLGAKLDSLGDLVFFNVALLMLIPLLGGENGLLLLFVIVFVIIIRAANLIIARVKFRQWGMVHTILNKLTGFALFIALPACVLTASLPLIIIIPPSIMAILSAVEESTILLTSKIYNANRKSIFVPE